MGRGVRQHVLQDGRIGHHGRAGDAGHAHRDQHEELGPRQAGQVAANEDRALHLAHEDGGGGGERRRAAQPHGLFEDQAEALGDPLQDAPVPEQGGQGADHQDHRQHPEGEDEQRGGVGQGVGLVLAAGQEAEHEGDARLGAGREPVHRVADAHQPVAQQRQAEQRHHQDRLHRDRAQRQLPREPAAVLRDRPAKPDGQRDAHQALRVLNPKHTASPPATTPQRPASDRGSEAGWVQDRRFATPFTSLPCLPHEAAGGGGGRRRAVRGARPLHHPLFPGSRRVGVRSPSRRCAGEVEAWREVRTPDYKGLIGRAASDRGPSGLFTNERFVRLRNTPGRLRLTGI